MARVFNGTSQYLSASSTLLTNEPIAMLAWMYPNSVAAAAGYAIVCLGNNGASGLWILAARGNVAGDPVTAGKNNDAGTGQVNADTSSGFSASTWQTAHANFSSDTSRDALLDGTNKGSNTTSRTDPTPDFISVGAARNSSVTNYFDGPIAEVFILDVVPSDAQHAIFKQGIHPIYAGIPVANIRGWYPLLGDDNNRMGGGYPNLSPTGSPTFGSHPATIIPPRLGSRCSF